MAFCNMCGAQIADGTTTCAACTSRVSAGGGGVATAAAPAQGMSDNVAGLLAYITIIPAIIFLVVAPYNKNRFIRFHAFQNLFLCVAAVALWIVLMILTVAATVVPVVGHLIVMLLGLACWVGFFVIWIVLLIKASQGQMWKLPVIGDMAEKQANAV